MASKSQGRRGFYQEGVYSCKHDVEEHAEKESREAIALTNSLVHFQRNARHSLFMWAAVASRPLLGQKFEEAVAKSINVCLRERRLPDAWSGSIVVPICKRHKSALATSSHRPIQLLLAEAKVMSRFLLEHLSQYVSTSWLQYAQVGVHPPLVVCQQYIAQSHDTRRSCALAFVDITAAYDDVSHQLLFTEAVPNHSQPDLVFDGLRAAGMSHTEASATQLYIREHPHHLLTNMVPADFLGLVLAIRRRTSLGVIHKLSVSVLHSRALLPKTMELPWMLRFVNE
eukprot:6468627-Amphidinium_carterae.2